ncbi:MAG: peptidoglycan recognition family protein [Phycisphaerales bacterium]
MTQDAERNIPDPNLSNSSRRDALLAIARAGSVGAGLLGISSLLIGCATSADRRVKAKGSSLGQPLPNDPTVISEPWTPDTRPARITQLPPQQQNALPAGLRSRSTWAKGAPRPWLADKMNSVRRITVHHDAIDPMPTGTNQQVAARLDSIRRGHLARGWADIGYHYAIDPSGQVWQGRPLHLQGAHVANQNQNNLGIVMLGNFERQRPTDRAVFALDRLIASEMRRYSIGLNEVRTHREMAPTACPGKNLQRAMDRTRSNGGSLASLAMGDIRG